MKSVSEFCFASDDGYVDRRAAAAAQAVAIHAI
jgi:hypothetical protein